jgi:Domain of unknown function (DUF4174)
MAVGLDLDQYQLKKRVLLVFAPTPEDARYREQHAFLQDEPGLLEKARMVVFGIFEDGPSFAEGRAVSHEDSQSAREDFGLGERGFGLRLIGLDGTEVLRSDEPVPVEDLLEAVAGAEE